MTSHTHGPPAPVPPAPFLPPMPAAPPATVAQIRALDPITDMAELVDIAVDLFSIARGIGQDVVNETAVLRSWLRAGMRATHPAMFPLQEARIQQARNHLTAYVQLLRHATDQLGPAALIMDVGYQALAERIERDRVAGRVTPPGDLASFQELEAWLQDYRNMVNAPLFVDFT